MKRLQMLLVLTLCAVGVQAEIYKIKDAKGNVTFTDTPATNLPRPLTCVPP